MRGTGWGDLRTFVTLFVGLLLVYGSFWHARDWNSASRLLLTYALVQDGSVEITPFVSVGGQLLPHPPTRDLSSPGDGRFFSDKAPGQSFAGVPATSLAQGLGGQPEQPDRSSGQPPLFPTDYWATWGTSGLATAVTAVLLAFALRSWGTGLRTAVGTGLAFGLATIALPYATHFYGHALAGLLALVAILLAEPDDAGVARGLAAGLAAGLAVCVEYPLAVLPVTIGLVKLVLAVLGRGRASFLPAFVVGGLPTAAALMAYHWAVTGSPFRVPYANEVEGIFAFHREGLGLAIGMPQPEALVGLLVGPRGLLWYSPLLLAAIPGTLCLARRRGAASVALVWGTAAGLWLLYAGFPLWDGGWSTGPRFLVPMVPLLMLPVGAWLAAGSGRELPWWQVCLRYLWLVLATGSGGTLLLITLAGGQIPPGISNPLSGYVGPILANSAAQPHLGQWLAESLGFPAETMAGWLGTLPVLALASGVVLATLVLAARPSAPGGTSR